MEKTIPARKSRVKRADWSHNTHLFEVLEALKTARLHADIAGCPGLVAKIRSAIKSHGGAAHEHETPRQRLQKMSNLLRGKFTDADRGALAVVETPHAGADLIRKMMEAARNAGHFRRYFSLRRAWLKASNP